MYTAVRFFPVAAIHSAKSLAWPTVSSASTRTASRSPEIKVADTGDQNACFSPGAESPPESSSGGATNTSQLSEVDWSVIGALWWGLCGQFAVEVVRPLDADDSVGVLAPSSHQG